MSEIKPANMYLASAIIIFFLPIGIYVSVSSYINYFLKSDIISYSFPLGLIIFSVPLLVWVSYWMIVIGYRKQKGTFKRAMKINKKITNSLAMMSIFGIILSFFFSFYVEYDLTSRGYVKCHKKSIHAPTKYIISKDMCE
ncbi:TPA: DUF1240 domain-containing protein [Morganella morganii]|nr:DUF1240 domain-containing protein [Morganella morganii]MCU6275608.1 DUF1240 domain-containing protein [Morganella morganii]HAT1528265.1 DUF1240 domain-containing protein [Morganella morganii]HDF2365973.1 DUF1240 domain-containing protein [Morganella morganii]HDF2423233.1 DUF1240 domain-containing protein [Morganella morganii]